MVAGATEITQLKVLFACDDGALRAGVRRHLEASGLRVVAEPSSAAEAVAAAIAHTPDVCLVAVELPGGGITAAGRIHQALPHTRIVMLAESYREEDLFDALRAGADGYLLKATSAERLPYALRGVVEGEAALPRKLAMGLVREFRDRGRGHRLQLPVSGESVDLTPREFVVLQHLRRGETTAQIAEHLHISEVTVRRHISASLRELGVPDRRSALALLERIDTRDRGEAV